MVRGTARSLAAALTLRSTVVRSLAYESQLHRIAAREPEVKAFTEPAGDIVARVERCDAGLLVAVKDNIACDGLPPASCGSELPPGAHAIRSQRIQGGWREECLDPRARTAATASRHVALGCATTPTTMTNSLPL